MMYHSKPYISKIAPRNLNANGKCRRDLTHFTSVSYKIMLYLATGYRYS